MVEAPPYRFSGTFRVYGDNAALDGVEHDWYGRCMIAILDARRWVMAIRSGINHIQWGKRDAIHLLTSSDEGRTWSKLNHWFDGTPIEGLP